MSRWNLGGTRVPLIALGLLISALAIFPTVSVGEGEVPPKAFETPEALVEALIAAAENNDDAALKALAGAQHADLIQPGGDPSVAKVRAEFAENAGEFWKLDDNEDGSKTLVVGDSRWPFPMPLVKGAAGWILDVAAGRQEMLARRIGENELNAIKLVPRLRATRSASTRRRTGTATACRSTPSTSAARPATRTASTGRPAKTATVSPFGPLVASAERVHADPAADGPVRRLLLAHPHVPGPLCSGRLARLPDQREHDRRLRADRLPRRVPRDGRDDLHRQPSRRRSTRRTWAADTPSSCAAC